MFFRRGGADISDAADWIPVSCEILVGELFLSRWLHVGSLNGALSRVAVFSCVFPK
jgi:hypothetical protein